MSNLSLNDNSLKTLGLRAKNERAKRKMDRGVFAEHVEVSVELLMSIEHGVINTNDPNCIKVLQELGLQIPQQNSVPLPITKRRKWKRFKHHSSFSILKRRLPRKQADIRIRRR